MAALRYFTIYYPELSEEINKVNTETWFENSYHNSNPPWSNILSLYTWRYNTNNYIRSANSTFIKNYVQTRNQSYKYKDGKLVFDCPWKFCYGFFASICKEYRSCYKPSIAVNSYIVYDPKYEYFNRNIICYTLDKPGTYDNRLIADEYTPRVYKNHWEFHDSNTDCIFCYNEWNLKLNDNSVFHVEPSSTLPISELPTDIFTVYNFGKNSSNSYYLIKVTGGGV